MITDSDGRALALLTLGPTEGVENNIVIANFPGNIGAPATLHDITNGADDPNAEPLDQNQGTWSEKFHQGNTKFLTKRLWGAASEPPYMHNGLCTTLRAATLAHDGEAKASRLAFESLPTSGRDSVIEFLKSLR